MMKRLTLFISCLLFLIAYDTASQTDSLTDFFAHGPPQPYQTTLDLYAISEQLQAQEIRFGRVFLEHSVLVATMTQEFKTNAQSQSPHFSNMQLILEIMCEYPPYGSSLEDDIR